MYIEKMTEMECRQALEHTNFGRIACARDNQPYIIPIYFSYEGKHIYGFTTVGQKIEWMRSNPLVCLEIDEKKSHEDWMSVIVFGRYEELPDTPDFACARIHAHETLRMRAMWWEPAFVAAKHRDQPYSFAPVFYRIHIARMTGHRATPELTSTVSSETPPQAKHRGLLSSILHPLRKQN